MVLKQALNIAVVVLDRLPRAPKEVSLRPVGMYFVPVSKINDSVILKGNFNMRFLCVVAPQCPYLCRCKCTGCSNKEALESKSSPSGSGVRAGHDGKHTQTHQSGSEYLKSQGMQAKAHSWTQGNVFKDKLYFSSEV